MPCLLVPVAVIVTVGVLGVAAVPVGLLRVLVAVGLFIVAMPVGLLGTVVVDLLSMLAAVPMGLICVSMAVGLLHTAVVVRLGCMITAVAVRLLGMAAAVAVRLLLATVAVAAVRMVRGTLRERHPGQLLLTTRARIAPWRCQDWELDRCGVLYPRPLCQEGSPTGKG
mmetsp:Transcript_48213/g.129053  ORF Transcript_48213/g.129053 Transcript_48213/m.129053 type:complete len:168 (+) Transcript_48213:719-1222(+)